MFNDSRLCRSMKQLTGSLAGTIVALVVMLIPAVAPAADVASASKASQSDVVRAAQLEVERQGMLKSREIRSGFPRLMETNFELLAPGTDRFNCIAWSAGITDRWVWPGANVVDFDKLYAEHGYRRLADPDYSVQPGVEKVVLYAKVTKDGSLTATHAARQEAAGTWSSKLGQCPLIRHQTPEDLVGPAYGLPIAVYIRVRGTN